MKRHLSSVHLVTAIGLSRDVMAMSTLIDSAEWRMDAEYELGRLGDVNIYRNVNANNHSADPEWELYGAVPNANVKAYKFKPEPPSAESQASNPTTATVAQVGKR